MDFSRVARSYSLLRTGTFPCFVSERKSGVPAFTAGKVRVARIYARCGIAAILLINARVRDTERNLLIACLSHLDLPDFSIENISTRFIPLYVNGGVK